MKGEKFYLNPGVYEELNETPTPQLPTEEELKKEELKNKLKLRYKEMGRKNVEVSKRYRDLKRKRPQHIFIPKEKRGWHDVYEKAIRNDTYRGNYNECKEDRVTIHRKSGALPYAHKFNGIQFRNPNDSNSYYDLNYSDVDLDEDLFANLNVNDVLDKDIFFEPHVSEPYKRGDEKQYDEDINYNENDNGLLHPPSPNDLIEIQDSLHDIVRISPSEFIKNKRIFYANNVNNLDNDLLKPPNFNDQINKSIDVSKNINDYIKSTIKKLFIKPGINIPQNRLLHPPINNVDTHLDRDYLLYTTMLIISMKL
jgi:hypothetical protein